LKKIFHLKHETKHPDRLLDTIKYEIRKYFKRERSKKLPAEATYWDFDCSFGQTKEDAQHLLASELITALDKTRESDWEQCFVEIISKPVFKAKAVSKK